MLSLLGRRFGDVCRATGAAEALCLIEQPEFAGKLGLVISGHHSAGIGGPAFVSELQIRIPHLPVLVLGSENESPANYNLQDVAFLGMPFAAEKLLDLSGQLLTHARNTLA